MQKWDFEKRVYEPYEVSEDWNCPLYSDDMDEAVNCASCGKEMNFGSGYTSLRIHNAFGFGYAVCEDCYKKEWEERRKYHG